MTRTMTSNRHLDQRLKVQHFRAVDAIATHGSLLKAATALSLTQPALSKSMRDVEDILKVKLFDRNPRGVAPTAAGLAFIESARRLLAELRRLDETLDVFSNPSQGAIAVGVLPAAASDAMAQMASEPAIAEYRRLLKQYLEARGAFEQEAGAYWNAISEKRRGRNAKRRDHQTIALDDYVLTQPPVYTGPKRPVNPAPEPEPERPPRVHRAIPVAADLVQAAAEQYQFKPQRPTSELEFKRAYAGVAAAAGLTREQAVRVYSFETGGTGNYDVQSGIEHGGRRAISTAIGYNQLLTTNTVELLAEQGPEFVKALMQKAAPMSGPPRQAMDRKIAVLKQMVAMARSVPDEWAQHEKIADTPQGWAMHAMVLDIDVGPLLQTHKLLTSVIFARAKGYNRPLSAAEAGLAIAILATLSMSLCFGALRGRTRRG